MEHGVAYEHLKTIVSVPAMPIPITSLEMAGTLLSTEASLHDCESIAFDLSYRHGRAKRFGTRTQGY